MIYPYLIKTEYELKYSSLRKNKCHPNIPRFTCFTRHLNVECQMVIYCFEFYNHADFKGA